MAPFIVLLAVTAICRALGLTGIESLASWSDAASVGLASMFLLTGSAHFTQRRRAGLIAIVPPQFSHPAKLVTLTGLVELLGAAALLVPTSLGPYRCISAWILTTLLLAVFPANIHASKAERSPSSPTTPLARRTVLQICFIASTVFVATTS